ncbi:MAG: hypothetical protein Q4E10_04405 [Porphyromonas sp.]|nr:hypothetical protein [Porphyromonas sp.]
MKKTSNNTTSVWNGSPVTLLLLLLLTLSPTLGCQRERTAPDITPVEGGKVELRLSPAVLAFESSDRLRADAPEEPTVDALTLFVFDDKRQQSDNAILLYVSEAKPLPDGTYSVELYERDTPCIVHAVANYTADDATIDRWIGKDEREVIAQLQGGGYYFWQRLELEGITPQTGAQSLPLLRNFAKVELVNNTADTFSNASIKLYHAADRGTVAPFDPESGTFPEEVVTEAPDALFSDPTDYATVHYAFDTYNQDNSPLFVILKGQYNGADSYYKIDLSKKDIDTTGQESIAKLDLLRNYRYTVTLNAINRAGASTEEEAVRGLAINSSVLDYALDAFPAIYSEDGTKSLSVEQTVFNVGAQTVEIRPRFSYKEMGVPMNNSVTVRVVEDEPERPLVQHIDETNKEGGVLILSLNPLPEGEATRQARVIFEVTKDNERMIRSILIVQYAPFSLEPVSINGEDPAVIDASLPAGQPAVISFKVPDDYPRHLYPIPVEIATSTLTPDGVTLPLKVVRREIDSHTSVNQIVYTYMVHRPGTYTVPFKTNKSDTQEAVTISAPNFSKAVTGYNIGRFTGRITYTYGSAGPLILPYREPELIGSSIGRISMEDRTTEGAYNIYLPIPLLEETEPTDEKVTVSAQLIFNNADNTKLTRVFSADLPVTLFRERYRADKEHPAPVDIDLTHTSTLILTRFLGVNHTDSQGGKETVLIPKETDVTIKIGRQRVPAKVWEDGALEIDLPVSEGIQNQSMDITLRIPTVTANAGLVVEEYHDNVPITDATVHRLVEIKRHHLAIYGSLNRRFAYIRYSFPNNPALPNSEHRPENRLKYTIYPPANLSDDERIKFEASHGGVMWIRSFETTLRQLRKDAMLYLE